MKKESLKLALYMKRKDVIFWGFKLKLSAAHLQNLVYYFMYMHSYVKLLFEQHLCSM